MKKNRLSNKIAGAEHDSKLPALYPTSRLGSLLDTRILHDLHHDGIYNGRYKFTSIINHGHQDEKNHLSVNIRNL